MNAITRAYAALHAGLGVAAWACVAYMAVGISLDIVLRDLGIASIPWMLESCEYAMFLLTFVGAPWALRLGAHVRVDVVLTTLPRAARTWLEAAGDVVGLVVAAFLLYYSASVAAVSRAEGARIIKEFIFPEWWIFALVSASAILIAVEFVVRLARLMREGAEAAGPDLENRGL